MDDLGQVLSASLVIADDALVAAGDATGGGSAVVRVLGVAASSAASQIVMLCDVPGDASTAVSWLATRTGSSPVVMMMTAAAATSTTVSGNGKAFELFVSAPSAFGAMTYALERMPGSWRLWQQHSDRPSAALGTVSSSTDGDIDTDICGSAALAACTDEELHELHRCLTGHLAAASSAATGVTAPQCSMSSSSSSSSRSRSSSSTLNDHEPSRLELCAAVAADLGSLRRATGAGDPRCADQPRQLPLYSIMRESALGPQLEAADAAWENVADALCRFPEKMIVAGTMTSIVLSLRDDACMPGLILAADGDSCELLAAEISGALAACASMTAVLTPARPEHAAPLVRALLFFCPSDETAGRHGGAEGGGRGGGRGTSRGGADWPGRRWRDAARVLASHVDPDTAAGATLAGNPRQFLLAARSPASLGAAILRWLSEAESTVPESVSTAEVAEHARTIRAALNTHSIGATLDAAASSRTRVDDVDRHLRKRIDQAGSIAVASDGSRATARDGGLDQDSVAVPPSDDEESARPLLDMLRRGVAFHHEGAPLWYRRRVERLSAAGKLGIVVATSASAASSLHAPHTKTVIIAGESAARNAGAFRRALAAQIPGASSSKNLVFVGVRAARASAIVRLADGHTFPQARAADLVPAAMTTTPCDPVNASWLLRSQAILHPRSRTTTAHAQLGAAGPAHGHVDNAHAENAFGSSEGPAGLDLAAVAGRLHDGRTAASLGRERRAVAEAVRAHFAARGVVAPSGGGSDEAPTHWAAAAVASSREPIPALVELFFTPAGAEVTSRWLTGLAAPSPPPQSPQPQSPPPQSPPPHTVGALAVALVIARFAAARVEPCRTDGALAADGGLDPAELAPALAEHLRAVDCAGAALVASALQQGPGFLAGNEFVPILGTVRSVGGISPRRGPVQSFSELTTQRMPWVLPHWVPDYIGDRNGPVALLAALDGLLPRERAAELRASCTRALEDLATGLRIIIMAGSSSTPQDDGHFQRLHAAVGQANELLRLRI
jgi:hypothetical protein